jgi:vitamin B12 transporter
MYEYSGCPETAVKKHVPAALHTHTTLRNAADRIKSIHQTHTHYTAPTMPQHTMKIIRFSILLICLSPLFLFRLSAQEDTMRVTLDEIQITALRSPLVLREASRQVEVVPRLLLSNMPAAAIEDVLRLSALVDVRRRGSGGAQADIGMRGSTFGQNLVLIDGMRASDPQTGHHVLAFGLRAGDVERIEILPGHMSALHGADAFGGTLNIVTRSADKDELLLRGGLGQFGKVDGGVTLSALLGRVHTRTGLDYIRHDGYRDGTDLQALSLTHSSRTQVAGSEITLRAHYTDKDFGAFDFYTPGRGIPSREQIHGGLVSLQARSALGSAVLRSGVSWRRLHDRFTFDSRTPDRNVNTHRTDVIQTEQVLFMDVVPRLQTHAGVAVSSDRIQSSSLGKHERSAAALFAGIRWHLLPSISVHGDLRFDAHSQTTPQWNPSIGIQAELREWLTGYVSVGRSFRLPSYTDLYYRDPVNSGSPDLLPEKAWSVESGARARLTSRSEISGVLFIRKQQQLIDFVLKPADNRYYARNIRNVLVQGGSLQLDWKISRLSFLRAQYQFVQSRLDGVLEGVTRYALTHPRHKVSGMALFEPTDNTGITTALVYVKPFSQGESHLTMDVRGHWNPDEMLTLRFVAENLFNSRIEEIPGLPLPGRWMSISAELRLF